MDYLNESPMRVNAAVSNHFIAMLCDEIKAAVQCDYEYELDALDALIETHKNCIIQLVRGKIKNQW